MFKSVATSFLVILLLSSFLFFFKLGGREFRNPDEGRYAKIAMEMVGTGNWVEPKLYQLDYLRKPPLFYWLIASSFKVFGFNESAARFIPALFGFLTVIATFFFCRKVFGLKEAVFSSLVLASNFWYISVSRYLVMDSTFSFFLVSSFYLFYLGVTATDKKRIYFILFYISIALAFLTKGVAGVVIPAFCLVLYAGFSGQFKKVLAEMNIGTGVLIFSAIALPWLVAIMIREPEFFKFFFLHEHLQRFFSKRFEHQGPWYFYIILLPAVFFPWLFFLQSLRKIGLFVAKRYLYKREFYLFCAFAGITLFYSMSKSKLPTYILPSIPFLSILFAIAWAGWKPEKSRDLLAVKLPLYALIAVATVIGLVSFYKPPFLENILGEGMMLYVRLIAVIVIAGSAAALIFLKNARVEKSFYAIVAFMFALSLLSPFALKRINEPSTTHSFAEMLKPMLKESDRVFIYGKPSAFYDFGFYLDFPVSVVGFEGELKFTKGDIDVEGSVVTREEFIDIFNTKNAYCMIRQSDLDNLGVVFKDKISILKETDHKLLIQSDAGTQTAKRRDEINLKI
ncbi:MAG: glycosyltransferase family 39 protein [Candidatus Omnitrophica bacterium]|nr:glycosyltransferase family 39 protein [Candidatus Omnitrophota bacterium]